MNYPSWFSRLFIGCAVILGLAIDAFSAPPESDAPEGGHEAAVMHGIFDTELPQLLRVEHLRFTLRPHFGDLIHDDYLGTTVTTRYGLTPLWELSSELDTFIAHGLKHEPLFGHNGVSRIRLGAKHKFEDFLHPFWDTAAGASYSLPLGRPPSAVTDGYRHFTPYFTMSHNFERRPNITGFISYGFDFVERTYTAVDAATDSLNDNSWAITPGLIIRRGAITYTLETSFGSTYGIGTRSGYLVGVRPSMEWNLPPKFKLNSHNRWILGVGLNAAYGSGGSDFGVNVRMQTDFDFRRLLHWNKSKPVDPAPSP